MCVSMEIRENLVGRSPFSHSQLGFLDWRDVKSKEASDKRNGDRKRRIESASLFGHGKTDKQPRVYF